MWYDILVVRAVEKPITKNEVTVCSKGEIPIEKNIFVVDEQGNEYDAIKKALE